MCCGFLLEQALVVGCGQPPRRVAVPLFPLDSLIEIVTVLMLPLGQAGDDEPVNTGGGVFPNSAAPLRDLDLEHSAITRG